VYSIIFLIFYSSYYFNRFFSGKLKLNTIAIDPDYWRQGFSKCFLKITKHIIIYKDVPLSVNAVNNIKSFYTNLDFKQEKKLEIPPYKNCYVISTYLYTFYPLG
jgi:N-acetylglutamate synthase-like GNAT family acetyltransferase